MGQNRVITTRVSPAAYKKLLQKCADGGCSTYEYFRQLVHTDVGLNEAIPVPEIEAESVPEPVPEPEEPNEEEKEDERDDIEKRYKIVG